MPASSAGTGVSQVHERIVDSGGPAIKQAVRQVLSLFPLDFLLDTGSQVASLGRYRSTLVNGGVGRPPNQLVIPSPAYYAAP